jgi:hypothetical protein
VPALYAKNIIAMGMNPPNILNNRRIRNFAALASNCVVHAITKPAITKKIGTPLFPKLAKDERASDPPALR